MKNKFPKLCVVAVLLVLALIITSCGGTAATTMLTTPTTPTTTTPTITSTTTTTTPPNTTTTTTTTTTPTTTTTTPTTTTPTFLFALIPHEPGESPKIPHPKNAAYNTCDLCHINPSTPISSIKIDDSHACNECHKLRDSGEEAETCQETIPVNLTCIFSVCHNYP